MGIKQNSTKKENKRKLGKSLKEHLGALEGDKEYGKIMKDLKKEWKKWTKKYS